MIDQSAKGGLAANLLNLDDLHFSDIETRLMQALNTVRLIYGHLATMLSYHARQISWDRINLIGTNNLETDDRPLMDKDLLG